MNFMGMGLAEIAVVMVVAFLVLGPSRTINLARTDGKLFADLRRTFSEVTAAITLEEEGQTGSPQAGSPQAGPPQAGSQWESRPVAQPQPLQEETTPVDLTREGLAPEDLMPDDPIGPAPSKNGDE